MDASEIRLPPKVGIDQITNVHANILSVKSHNSVMTTFSQEPQFICYSWRITSIAQIMIVR